MIFEACQVGHGEVLFYYIQRIRCRTTFFDHIFQILLPWCRWFILPFGFQRSLWDAYRALKQHFGRALHFGLFHFLLFPFLRSFFLRLDLLLYWSCLFHFILLFLNWFFNFIDLQGKDLLNLLLSLISFLTFSIFLRWHTLWANADIFY